ncbi:TIGR01777 family oxidoreductase [Actinomycetospora sp. TBRC 11914]|uniref:TIGR01777 family oxidoreductase n=1 Tax=Actinomycetospora sp. TBRC 11914 TaxID=2729387 RepID=UPI00145D81B7|nr:TIGR01777 family oxidoreductase [Actinomycetospora sp. TBRC 11914]NMO92314.1 TIGR01777 family protein [Actinomycetospora sp. TBRC 11914]
MAGVTSVPDPGRVVVTGAHGWIGDRVGAALQERGWAVVGVSRTPSKAGSHRPGWTWVGTGPELDDAVAEAGAVVNLAGRNVFEQRWTPEYVETMRRSRVDLTRRVAAALGRHAGTAVLVSASGFTVCGDAGETELPDDTPASRDLVLGDVYADWEEAALEAPASVRVVVARLGVVLGPDHGAFDFFRRPFLTGRGSVLGPGDQWVPWIHVDDVVGLLLAGLEDERYRGVVHVVAPDPVRHRELAAELAASAGAAVGDVEPVASVRARLGPAAEMLVTSQRMVPRRALEHGYRFRHPRLDGAVADLVVRDRA